MDDSTLTQRLCTILGGIDGWAWRPQGPAFTASEVGVNYGSLPDDGPDRVVGVRVYGTADDRERHERGRRVQLRFRGERHRPDGADVLADAAFAVLPMISRHAGISGIDRLSMSPLGADGNGREERTDNYIVTLDNEEADQP